MIKIFDLSIKTMDSTDPTTYLAVIVLSLFFYYAVRNWKKNRNVPPGPWGLPFVGYYPFLGKAPHLKLTNLSKQYGGIFSFYIGSQLVVCVCDSDLAKDILNHPKALARPSHTFEFLTGRGGFFSQNGEEWQEQRRFSLHTIRNLGLGKGQWETLIQEGAAEIVDSLTQTAGAPVSIEEQFAVFQVRNTLSLLFDRRLDHVHDGEDLKEMLKVTKEASGAFSPVSLSVHLPWIIKTAEYFNLMRFKELMCLVRRLEAIFENEIRARRKIFEQERSRNDYIGCYFQEIENKNKEGKDHTMTDLSLQGNLFFLFIAGLEPTTIYFNWLLLVMARHLDVQDKICQEIDREIGRDGAVCYDDRSKLPYTWSTVLEVMRWISFVPLFLPRYIMDSFTFRGYTIPKGSHLVTNIWTMQHDSRNFDDPMDFRPERFLPENVSKVSKTLGPFSYGRRNCPGEKMAMMTTYLCFVSVLQKFNVRTPGGGLPDLTSTFSFGLAPKEQNLCFIER